MWHKAPIPTANSPCIEKSKEILQSIEGRPNRDQNQEITLNIDEIFELREPKPLQESNTNT